jgi:hypothetical protein
MPKKISEDGTTGFVTISEWKICGMIDMDDTCSLAVSLGFITMIMMLIFAPNATFGWKTNAQTQSAPIVETDRMYIYHP